MDIAAVSEPFGLVARAADVAMMLEHLFHEASNSKIGFRLGMSVAWTLEKGTDAREHIIKTLKTVYALGSKRVYGAVSAPDQRFERTGLRGKAPVTTQGQMRTAARLPVERGYKMARQADEGARRVQRGQGRGR